MSSSSVLPASSVVPAKAGTCRAVIQGIPVFAGMTLVLSLLFFLITPAFACTVTDDAGHTIQINQPAQRIISLSPDLSEILLVLGAEKSVVGVIAGSDYPPQAKNIRRVGDYHALDRELILALHPDLIVAWGESHEQDLNFFKQQSIPVYVSHPDHLLDIPRTIKGLGCLAGKEEQAKHLTKKFVKEYDYLSKKYNQNVPGRARLRVFYEIAAHPLITVNRRSWINDAIELCGGQNIFAQEYYSEFFKQTAFTVSLESVLRANPEVIMAGLPSGWQKQWLAWPSLTAVKTQRLISINPDLIDRPGPRILEGVGQVCRKLQLMPSSRGLSAGPRGT